MDIEKQLDLDAEVLTNKISLNDIRLIKTYTKEPVIEKPLYESISEYQQSGSISSSEIYLKKCITILHKVIKLSPLTESLVVYHGGYIMGKKGQVINTNTFLSTSLDPHIAIGFATESICEIHLPKGYPALWTRPYSLYPCEKELILLDNSHFLIDSVRKRPCGGSIKRLVLLPVGDIND